MTEHRSYCRLCGGVCGTRVTVGADGRIASVRGDKAHAMTRGYACIKGLQAPELHNGPDRLLHPLKRGADGGFTRMPLEQALDEIAARLRRIADAFGPESVALFRGTQNYQNLPAFHMALGFLKALGSGSFYSTMTIDQSAKWVTLGRLGAWSARRQDWQTADVWLFAGYNPLVSVQGGTGFPALDPSKRLREAKARGLKLIVVDPRRSETAGHADLHLQIHPGEDATLAAGLLNVILTRNWQDAGFCADHVDGLAALRRAVASFPPDAVAARTGVPARQIIAAAEMFAQTGRRGAATTGTGPDMGPHSNLAEHLYECLNVLCGRYPRVGEAVPNPGVLGPRGSRRAEVHAPRRPWEAGSRSPSGYGQLYGERMSNTIADDILTPGAGRLRALVSLAGNPVVALPGSVTVARAFRDLDLLVAIEPFMTQTARLSHYILPPKLMYERADITLFSETFVFPEPFAQHTPALVPPPAGADVADEWYFFWGLARRLGLDVEFDGVPLDRASTPTTEALLDVLARKAQVPLPEVRRHPGGAVFDVPPQIVRPAGPNAGRFAVAPPDVVAEIAAVQAEAAVPVPAAGNGTPYTYRLAVRRLRAVINGAFHHVPAIRRRVPYNPARLHPADLNALGLAGGQRIVIESAHGRITAIVEADDTLKPGTVTLSHGWGSLPDDADACEQAGAAVNRLIDARDPVEPINAMARLTGVPVRLFPA